MNQSISKYRSAWLQKKHDEAAFWLLFSLVLMSTSKSRLISRAHHNDKTVKISCCGKVYTISIMKNMSLNGAFVSGINEASIKTWQCSDQKTTKTGGHNAYPHVYVSSFSKARLRYCSLRFNSTVLATDRRTGVLASSSKFGTLRPSSPSVYLLLNTQWLTKSVTTLG